MPEPKTIYRFPRPPRKKFVFNLAESLRQEPKATIKVARDGGTLDFKFRMFVDPTSCSRVFDSPRAMQKALQRAYLNGKWGHSTVPHAVSLILGRICRNAIKGYLVARYTVAGPKTVYRDYHAHIAEMFEPLSQRIKASQPNFRLAKKLAKLYRRFLPAIRDVRMAMRKNQMTDDEILRELEKRIPEVDPLRALTLISPLEGGKTIQILRSQILNSIIARSYLECVIKKHRWTLGNASLDTYLRRGKQILS